ncbi:hypothetical protein G9A89_020610 [Geosiphon pyriformis]|nr:hypothetical protein G9A89_020610 [Geosiphon pyriformis]
MSSGIAIAMNNSLAKHVYKVSEVPGQLLSIKLLFKNKLSVSILGFYAGASVLVQFSQAGKINFLIAKTVNESSFIVFSGDFNENGPAVKTLTWCNSCGVSKMIDYVFVSSNLVNAIVNCSVADVMKHFNTNHMTVSVSVSLDANKDHWKFDVKNMNDAKRCKFNTSMAANAVMFLDDFFLANIIREIMVLLANRTFKKRWFKGFKNVFIKVFSRFHKLKLLVSKLVKALCSVSGDDFASLLKVWNRLDSTSASAVRSLFLSVSNFGLIHSALAKTRKLYCFSKLLEFRRAEESFIRQTINKRMKSFELDKGHTIRSMLEHSFCKVVLDHLVVDDELVLESELVKSKVDVIIEKWTRKHKMVTNILDDWICQFQPLDYIFDGAFSNVMGLIGFDKMFAVVSNLSDGKAASLSGISNELWKCCNKSVLDMLLVLLNCCLVHESESVFTNTHSIVLIETACKILSKILLDRISSACSTFDVLHEDNFSVLKDTLTQSPIFAIDMHKAYDSVEWVHLKRSLVRIKMCNRFIGFFGGIHNSHVNRMITDFGLTDRYCVKRQESMCEYRLNSHFVSKNGQAESQARLTSFFTAGAFVDNTIWVGNSQAATQHILDVAVAYQFLSQRKVNLTIIWVFFLLIEGLLKPSLAKTHLNVHFFVNFVLRKAISNKHFAYLVLAVLFPIIDYRTQFSYVHLSVCNKWDALICKCLKSKSGLSHDFPSDTLYYPSLYNLKSFKQIQAEDKSASTVFFANSAGILGWLFSYRSHDFKVFSWNSCHPLQFPACVKVNSSNNFLAGMVFIFFGCDLSLDGSLVSVFCLCGGTSLSFVLDESVYCKYVTSFWHYEVAFIEQLHDWNGVQLDSHGPVFLWFKLSVCFLVGVDFLSSDGFGIVSNSLLSIDASHLSVYMDGSLSGLETLSMKAGATVFFKNVGLGLGVGVSDLVSSIMMELQAIALALECVPLFYYVNLFSDSQAALDACKMESLLVCPDFRNWCWIKCHHILNVIHCKNLVVNWVKVKGHSGVLDNEHVDKLAKDAVFSDWFLSYLVGEHFLKAGGTAVSGNSKHFVRDVFRSVHQTHYEIGSGLRVMMGSLRADINWYRSSLVWHPDSHLAAGFTSMQTAGFQTYFMKLLATCAANIKVGSALCKSFVFNEWYRESVTVFKDSKIASLNIVSFVHELCLAFQEDIWLVRTKHQTFMEKNNLILRDGSIPILVAGLFSVFLAGVIKLLGIANVLGVGFGFYKSCLFFSGIGDLVSVNIGV